MKGGRVRRRWGRVAGLALLAPLLLAGSDPDLDWFTLDTAHFSIHFPDGLQELAQRTALAAEQAHDTMAVHFGWTPLDRTEVVLRDFDDSANGLANVRPYSRITLLAHPPPASSALAHYGDYWRLLVFHEYAHILHLEHVTGAPAWVVSTFGRAYFPAQSLPRWMIEGIAVWAESTFTAQGRNHRGFFRTYLRTAALEGVLPDLSELSAAPLWPPRGEMQYAQGGAFVDWLVVNFGEAALRRFIDQYGSRLLGFGMNTAAIEAFGASLDSLHRSFRDDIAADARAWLSARQREGLREGDAMTSAGETHAYPRVSPDGSSVVYLRDSGRAPTELRVRSIELQADASTERSVMTCWGGCASADWAPDGASIYVAQPQWHRWFYRFHDVYRVDVETGRSERLTRARRAQAPAVSPDGRRMVYTASSGGGKVDLVHLDLRTREEHAWIPSGATYRQPSDPRWSPDGRWVAFSMAAEGTRDIWLYDVALGEARALMRDDEMDLTPVFSGDSRFVLFSSDRQGAFDIFAVPVESDAADGTRPLYRVTRVATAALDPAVVSDASGAVRAVVYRRWSHRGWDLWRIDTAAPEWELAGRLRADAPPDSAQHETISAPPESEWLPRRPYSALPTLRPRAWLPDVRVAGGEFSTQLELSASDIAGFHRWSLLSEFSTAADTPTIGLSYRNDRLVPTLSTDLFWYRDRVGGEVNYRRFEVDRDVYTAGVAASLPFHDNWKSHTFRVGVDGVFAFPHEAPRVQMDPTARPPRRPSKTTRLVSTVSWRHRSSRSFSWSVSREYGRDLGIAFSVESPLLGSDTEAWTFRWDWNEYVSLGRGHALALRYDGGISGSPTLSGRGFRIGGVPSRPLFEDILNRRGLGAGLLRGFEAAAFRGDQLHLFHAEWRFPIAYVHRGIGSLPFFVRRIHGVVFVDSGTATSEPLLHAPWYAGFGAELRADLDVFFGRGVGLRLGIARGLGVEGETSWYFVSGSGF